MLIIEKFAREEKGFTEAYLCTIDRQIFYSRCGYSFCDPVCAYSGNIKLPSGLTSTKPKMGWDQIPESTNNSADSKVKTIETSHENQDKTELFSEKDGILRDKAENYKPNDKDCQNCDIQSTSSNKVIPNMTIINSEDVTDLSVLCAKLYCRPSLPSNPPEPLKLPLRSLAKNNTDKINKISKNEICRATIPKDYMKKIL